MDIPKNIDAIEERIKQILSEAPKFAQKIIDDIKVLNPNVLQELAKAKPMQTINNKEVWALNYQLKKLVSAPRDKVFDPSADQSVVAPVANKVSEGLGAGKLPEGDLKNEDKTLKTVDLSRKIVRELTSSANQFLVAVKDIKRIAEDHALRSILEQKILQVPEGVSPSNWRTACLYLEKALDSPANYIPTHEENAALLLLKEHQADLVAGMNDAQKAVMGKKIFGQYVAEGKLSTLQALAPEVIGQVLARKRDVAENLIKEFREDLQGLVTRRKNNLYSFVKAEKATLDAAQARVAGLATEFERDSVADPTKRQKITEACINAVDDAAKKYNDAVVRENFRIDVADKILGAFANYQGEPQMDIREEREKLSSLQKECSRIYAEAIAKHTLETSMTGNFLGASGALLSDCEQTLHLLNKMENGLMGISAVGDYESFFNALADDRSELARWPEAQKTLRDTYDGQLVAIQQALTEAIVENKSVFGVAALVKDTIEDINKTLVPLARELNALPENTRRIHPRFAEYQNLELFMEGLKGSEWNLTFTAQKKSDAENGLGTRTQMIDIQERVALAIDLAHRRTEMLNILSSTLNNPRIPGGANIYARIEKFSTTLEKYTDRLGEITRTDPNATATALGLKSRLRESCVALLNALSTATFEAKVLPSAKQATEETTAEETLLLAHDMLMTQVHLYPQHQREDLLEALRLFEVRPGGNSGFMEHGNGIIAFAEALKAAEPRLPAGLSAAIRNAVAQGGLMTPAFAGNPLSFIPAADRAAVKASCPELLTCMEGLARNIQEYVLPLEEMSPKTQHAEVLEIVSARGCLPKNARLGSIHTEPVSGKLLGLEVWLPGKSRPELFSVGMRKGDVVPFHANDRSLDDISLHVPKEGSLLFEDAPHQ